jgi:hypothetical protein
MGGTAIRKGYTNNQFKIVVSNQSRNTSNSSIINFTIPSSVNIISPSSPIAQQEKFCGKLKKLYAIFLEHGISESFWQ